MPGPVVVEVTAASPDAAQITAMVEACGRAVGHTSCVLARQAPEPPYEAVAIVTWLGDARVRVETALRRADQSSWRSRELVFQASDQEIERWRAIGFVVGSLASAAIGEESGEARSDALAESPAPVVPPVAPEPAPASAPAAVTTPRRIAWLGLGWYAGDGLDADLDRNGAWGRVGLRPAAMPIVAIASLAYGASSRASSAVGTSYLDGGLGLGVALIDQSTATLDLGLEFGAERFVAQADQGSLGSASRARWVGVLRLRPEVALYWSEVVGTTAFGELSLRGGQTEVSVGGEAAGETSRLGYRFGLGLCVRTSR